MNQTASVLGTLSCDEKAVVLQHLLDARADLRAPAESIAVSLMSEEDRSAVADDVECALRGRDIEELNGRAGRQPGRGYADPGEAAGEILDEELVPFVDDLGLNCPGESGDRLYKAASLDQQARPSPSHCTD